MPRAANARIESDNAERQDLDIHNMTPHQEVDDPGEDDDMRRAAEADEAAKRGGKPSKSKPKSKPAAKEVEEEEETEGEEEEETEGEGEGEEEEETEGEEEEDSTPAAKRTVPYDRFSKVNRRMREAETRAAELQAKLDASTAGQTDKAREAAEREQNEILALYEQAEEARLAGNTKEAARIQRQIDERNRTISDRTAGQIAVRQAIKVQETAAFNAMVEQLEALDSRFDKESDDFDEDALNEVNDLVNSFERDGIKLPVALRRAVKYVTGTDVLSPKSIARAGKAEPETKPKPKADLRKKLDSASRQPPDIRSDTSEKSGAGKDVRALLRTGKLDELSEADLDALASKLAGGKTNAARGGRLR